MSTFRDILIADKTPLFGQELQRLLSSKSPHSVVNLVHHADHLDNFTSACSIKPSQPTLIIVDRCLPGLKSYEQLNLGTETSKTPVLLMAESTDGSFLAEAWDMGITGVISKSATAEQFNQAIEQIGRGERWFWRTPHFQRSTAFPALTERQSRVLALLREGRRNRQIAKELHLSEHTVKYHISQIYQKMDIPKNRTLLALTA